MSKEEIIKGALELDEDERAKLARSLLVSLEEMSPEKLEDTWVSEVAKRAKELDDGTVQPVSSDEVREKAKAILR